ncbi:MAG: DNA/RNA nuclease SfsA [Caldilineaceae bacterium]
MVRLEPKYDTDPEFAAALATAADAGVELYAYTCDLTPERILCVLECRSRRGTSRDDL